MAEEKMVTLMVDETTRNLLRELANRNVRSMAGQVRFMVLEALRPAALNPAPSRPHPGPLPSGEGEDDDLLVQG